MKTKIISSVLSTILLMSVFSGCSEQKTNQTSVSSSDTTAYQTERTTEIILSEDESEKHTSSDVTVAELLKTEDMIRDYINGRGELVPEMLSNITELNIYGSDLISVAAGDKKATQVESTHDIDRNKRTFKAFSYAHYDNESEDDVEVSHRVLPSYSAEHTAEYSFGTLTDLSFLKDMPNLEVLNVSFNNVSDISPVSELNNLKVLCIFYNDLSDISPISTITGLEELYLEYDMISDISPASNLDNLTTLSLVRNNITDISPLNGLKNLNYLYLSENNISNVAPLSSLTNLKELELYSNAISEISAIGSINGLSELDLGNNSISDISVLSNLTGLEKLYLHENNITDITPVFSLKKLRDISLYGNDIADNDLADFRTAFPYCGIASEITHGSDITG